MELRQYIHAVRKYWWLVVVCFVVGGLYGAFVTSRSEETYRGSVTFFVRTVGEGTASSANVGDMFAQRRVNSYLALLSTDRLAGMVVSASGVDLSPGQVSSRIGAQADIDTVLLTATVEDSSRARALQLAEALSTEVVALIDQVENPTAGSAAVSLEVVSGPEVGVVPVATSLTVATRAAIGLFLGIALAVLFDLLDNTVRSTEQQRAVGRSPVLGTIGFDRRAGRAPLTIQDDAHSTRAEAFRQLRTNLQFIDVDRPVRVLVVTSSVAGEGKSSIVANLALAMTGLNRRVLVVESDLRRPRVADMFGVERAIGLTDVLAGRASLDDILQPWGAAGLVLLPSGTLPPNPSELLGSDEMGKLVATLRDRFDHIVIDTPPILPVTDAAVMASYADGVILVVRHGKTTRHQIDRAMSLLERVGARVLGTVGSMVPQRGISGYQRYQTNYESLPEPQHRNGSSDDGRRVGPRLLSRARRRVERSRT